MLRTNLDTDILRTLVTARQLGGFSRAAQQIGRSQSAVSQQIRKLEEQVGQPLFRKEGRNLALTEAGDVILSYARRILDLNDEAVAAVRGSALEGTIRFGLPIDFAESWLPMALGRFRRAHPGIRIEANTERRAILIDRLDKEQLDLVLLFGGGLRSDALRLAKLPMAWIGSSKEKPNWQSDRPLPLAVFNPPCFFRETAIAALDRAGIPWHIAFTSLSLHGIWAAVDAGLGITLRTVTGLPNQLMALDKKSGLPSLPLTHLSLHRGGRELTAAATRFKENFIGAVTANLAMARKAQRN